MVALERVELSFPPYQSSALTVKLQGYMAEHTGVEPVPSDRQSNILSDILMLRGRGTTVMIRS
jgi:hypothetical protein